MSFINKLQQTSVSNHVSKCVLQGNNCEHTFVQSPAEHAQCFAHQTATHSAELEHRSRQEVWWGISLFVSLPCGVCLASLPVAAFPCQPAIICQLTINRVCRSEHHGKWRKKNGGAGGRGRGFRKLLSIRGPEPGQRKWYAFHLGDTFTQHVSQCCL